MVTHRIHESGYGFVASLGDDVHAVFTVQNPPGDAILLREPIDERPEPDSLHDAGDAKPNRA
jgi:hypothetical protein